MNETIKDNCNVDCGCTTTCANETTQDKIRRVANSVRDLLIEKNKAYGDSALGGAQVFSHVSTTSLDVLRRQASMIQQRIQYMTYVVT